MTREKFERACEIKESMEIINELEAVLNNSVNNGCGERYLAAIDAKRINGYTVEACKVNNHVRVPDNIMKKFKDILSEEYDKLDKEFEAL